MGKQHDRILFRFHIGVPFQSSGRVRYQEKYKAAQQAAKMAEQIVPSVFQWPRKYTGAM